VWGQKRWVLFNNSYSKLGKVYCSTIIPTSGCSGGPWRDRVCHPWRSASVQVQEEVATGLREEKEGSRGLDHPGPQYRQTHRVSTHCCAGLPEEAEVSRWMDYSGPQHRKTHMVSAGLQEEAEGSGGLDHSGPQHRHTCRVSSGLWEEAEGFRGLDHPGSQHR